MSASEDDALVALLRTLTPDRYHFIAPTPATHARVIAREDIARDLRDALGWSMPFQRETVDPDIFVLLERGGVLAPHARGFISRVRVSTFRNWKVLHSAYPTLDENAVFFGPDTYRFGDFIVANLRMGVGARVVDIGTGSGAGAMMAASMQGAAEGTDINPLALRYAGINFRAAGLDAKTHLGSGLAGLVDPIDAVIANPPYIVDDAHRAYRDGGAMHGAELALNWARDVAVRLARGGQFLLYTGSAIIDGRDPLKEALHEILTGFDIAYRELDPDVFGEELERDAYAGVERIAVVGVVAIKR